MFVLITGVRAGEGERAARTALKPRKHSSQKGRRFGLSRFAERGREMLAWGLPELRT